MYKLIDYFTAQKPRKKENQRGFDISAMRQKPPKPSGSTKAKLENQVCTMKKIKTLEDLLCHLQQKQTTAGNTADYSVVVMLLYRGKWFAQ